MYPMTIIISDEKDLIEARDKLEYLSNEEVYKKLGAEIIQNYPEYSSEHISCCRWSEDTYEFLVENPDTESHEKMSVTGADIAHEIPGFISKYRTRSYLDACAWDSEDTDMLMQLHFYGEVVFG